MTVATLDKFEAGQAGWYYDGCGVCTKSVSLKEGKLKCYANHITTETETVPRCVIQPKSLVDTKTLFSLIQPFVLFCSPLGLVPHLFPMEI